MIFDVVLNLLRDQHTSGHGQRFDARCQVDAVAIDGPVVDGNVAGMDADPKFDTRFLLHVLLDRHGTVHGVERAGEEAQATIAIMLKDPAVMRFQAGVQYGLEARPLARPGVPAGEDHLQGHGPVEAGMPRLVDDAHSAAAQLAEHLVARRLGGGEPRPLRSRPGEGLGLLGQAVDGLDGAEAAPDLFG